MLVEKKMKDIIKMALEEDMPMGDITTDSIFSDDFLSQAILIAKQEAVIAGLKVCEMVFKTVDGKVDFKCNIKEGDYVEKGTIIAEIYGSVRALLKAERTALNLLQRMSGIATKTSKLAKEIEDLPTFLVDTRKTTPGIRMFEKYAVKVGGGRNHRFCLSDGVMIKDNHIKAAGGIKQAVSMVKEKVPHTIKIEVETENLKQVAEAIEAGADIIMLDNMDIETMKQAVKFIDGRAITEASGNITLGNIRKTALTGVDIISVGEITHSVNAIDISMKILM